MTYDDKADRHEKQVLVRFNEADYARLRSVARSLGVQHSVLGRDVLKAFIEAVEETGSPPEWAEKQLA